MIQPGRRIVKKAVVVGGSNGMGLAVSVELIKNGYFVEIADVVPPILTRIYSGDWQRMKT